MLSQPVRWTQTGAGPCKPHKTAGVRPASRFETGGHQCDPVQIRSLKSPAKPTVLPDNCFTIRADGRVPVMYTRSCPPYSSFAPQTIRTSRDPRLVLSVWGRLPGEKV